MLVCELSCATRADASEERRRVRADHPRAAAASGAALAELPVRGLRGRDGGRLVEAGRRAADGHGHAAGRARLAAAVYGAAAGRCRTVAELAARLPQSATRWASAPLVLALYSTCTVVLYL